MPSKTPTPTDGDNSMAAMTDAGFFHHNIEAQHHASAALSTGMWRPESAPASGHHLSPSPLFSRLTRGTGRRHQSESPSGRPARMAERRSGSSSGGGCRNYSANTSIRRYSSTRSASAASGVPPPLTREEFEALPVAIQRKVRAIFFTFPFSSSIFFGPPIKKQRA